jgi:acetyl esterase/lipase
VRPDERARFGELLAFWALLAGESPTIEQLRRLQRRAAPVAPRPLAEVADLSVGDVPVRLYRPRPRSAGPLPVLVYLHGGGWVLGDIESVDGVCRDLAEGAGCAVVNVGYRLAPEHPFPAAVEDSWAVTRDVVRRPGRYGADPRAVAVGGDSAGGNLAAAVALLARDEAVPLAHQLLVYPATDTARDTASWKRYATGYGLDAATMAGFMDLYRGSADPADPRLAPLRAADLAGVAAATVITAEQDILCDEAEAYAARLAAAGVPVELRRFAGAVHSFFLLPEIFEAGARARKLAARRLRAAFAAAREGDAA